MEIQRNKTLNRLFIVLAVLTIVLRSASMILEIWHDGSIHLGLLCSLLCAVLPILAMACSRHKAASIVFSVAYIIVLAFVLWVTQIANGRLASLTSWNLVSNCANILIDCTYGIFPLLNAVGKVENKKKLAITCLILGGIATIWNVYSLIDELSFFYWRRSLFNVNYRVYYYAFNTTYYLSYCVILFAIGMGILRDVPPEMFKKKQAQEGDHTMSSKSKQTAMLFSIFTGVLGVDRFYLGYTALGVLKLLTAGGAGIWALIDFIRIGVDSLRPADGSPWVEETRDENIRSIAANMQAIAEKLEKLQAQNVPAEAEKPQTDGENQETHKVSLKK